MSFNKDSIINIIDSISSKKIMVFGDIMLDEYIWGDVNRISPEAPVPVVDVKEQNSRLGGAANVVCNLAALGVETSILTVTGDDSKATDISEILSSYGCNIDGLIKSTSRKTTVKTRIMAHNQQVVRVDIEDRLPISEANENLILDKFMKVVDGLDGLIISDYGKGVITPNLLSKITEICHKHSVFISVDPKENHFSYYNRVDVITPNLKEGYGALGLSFNKMPSDQEIAERGWEIVDKFNLKYLLLTLSEKGMALFDSINRDFTHLSTAAIDVYDVTGAGDTVISSFTASIVAGATPIEATYLANEAAGLAVSRIGTVSVSIEDLKKQIL